MIIVLSSSSYGMTINYSVFDMNNELDIACFTMFTDNYTMSMKLIVRMRVTAFTCIS
jgi:hypothetical protein